MVKVRPKRGNAPGWEVDIRFRWPDGSIFRERKNTLVTGKDNARRWGEARERTLLAEGKTATIPVAIVPTFAEFWPRVVADHYRAERKKPSTIDAVESIFANHLVAVHKKPLDTISAADIASLKARLADAAPKTVNNVLSVLSKSLHCAVRWGVLGAMPCRVDLLRTSEPSMAWYEVDDYRRLVTAASFSRRVLVLILLAGSAGLRRGEIRALRWTDLDMVRRQVRVESSLWRQEEGTTKGGRYRIVPMTDELAAVLREHRHLGERVLYSERELELSNRTIRNWLSRAQRRAGLQANGGIHILRHTFCSHLAAAGVPAKAIQELAGHADLKTTLRYMHLSPGDRDGAIATLGRYYGVGEKKDRNSTPKALRAGYPALYCTS